MASKFKTVSSELTLEEAFSPENIRSRLKKPEDIFRFEYCTMNEKQFKSIAISPLAWTEGENRQAAAIRSLHKQDGKTIPIVAMTANAFRRRHFACRKRRHERTHLQTTGHDTAQGCAETVAVETYFLEKKIRSQAKCNGAKPFKLI